MITYEKIRQNEDVRILIAEADQSLAALGYTDHSFAHVGIVAERSAEILSALGVDEREIELAKIAAYLHDIGNLVNRSEHSQSGAVMAFRLLDKMGMDMKETATIVAAIGNHDEGTGVPVSRVAAALIIADKSDVRRSRVRNRDFATFDIHDRVNYSVVSSNLKINPEDKTVRLSIEIDTSIGSIMDYFEIFLGRMTLCRRAADKLGLAFKLTINDQSFI
ncbi:MAG: HD domain-containing protein [Clostridia bacterium]|nr:HD domain-containing protein [Clostridia bacterium]